MQYFKHGRVKPCYNWLGLNESDQALNRKKLELSVNVGEVSLTVKIREPKAVVVSGKERLFSTEEPSNVVLEAKRNSTNSVFNLR